MLEQAQTLLTHHAAGRDNLDADGCPTWKTEACRSWSTFASLAKGTIVGLPHWCTGDKVMPRFPCRWRASCAVMSERVVVAFVESCARLWRRVVSCLVLFFVCRRSSAGFLAPTVLAPTGSVQQLYGVRAVAWYRVCVRVCVCFMVVVSDSPLKVGSVMCVPYAVPTTIAVRE